MATLVILGARLKIADDGEGWFSEYHHRDLLGTIHGSSKCPAEPGYGYATVLEWYTVELDEVLELQESGFATPSGLRLVRYSHALVAPRHGEDFDDAHALSCFLKLVREGDPLPQSAQEINRLPKATWARCSIVEDAQGR